MDRNDLKLLMLLEKFERSKHVKEDIRNYEMQLRRKLFCEKTMKESPLYQNVLTSYQNWFHGISMNEYFEDSWEKLFSYLRFPPQICEEASWWNLEMIYSEKEKILRQQEIGEKESEFLGDFRTCFPDIDNVSVINLARDYFHDFSLFQLTMFPTQMGHLTSLEKIKLGSIWVSDTNDLKLERKR